MIFDIFPALKWQDVVDILVISVLVHRLFLLFRGTSVLQVMVGLLFLWLLHAYYRVGMRGYRLMREGTMGGIAMGYVAGVFALATHAIGSNTFIILRIMEPFMLFTGILVSLIRLREEAQPEAEKKPPELPQRELERTQRIYPRTIDLVRESRQSPRHFRY